MSEDAKPPYVTFEVRAVEDRTASIEKGHYMSKDVIYAVITPAGTKDRIEKVAEDWLTDLEEAVRQERFPTHWLRAYRQAFESWKETREIPENGTPVANCALFSPAQVKILLDLNLRTVEQVAEAHEEALARIGMGARALKQRAQAWLDSSKGQGQLAGELEELRQAISELRQRDSEREEELSLLRSEKLKLEAALEAQTSTGKSK